jgi:MHS family shikimate/dehydroshikimate transporter-like MFS transporter
VPSTPSIGLLPTYDAVGVWAPVLLVALRFVQGLGLGGEWAGALLMSVEHAPPNRRGLYASWPQVGLASGLLLSTAAFAGAAAVTGAAFATWGWRIPFLLSVLLVGVGIFIRLRIVESPAFVQLHASGDRSRRPLVEVVRDHPWTMVFATGASFSAFLIFYTGAVFVLAYATDQLGMPRSTVLVAVMIAAAAEAVTLPLFGALSDRIGRRPVCIAGAAFTALFAFPFFWLIDTGRPLLVGVALLLVFGVGHATYGATGALLAEQFPARVRYSGTSLSYQLTAVLVGAPTPLLASGLLAWSDGNSWPLSALLALGGLVTLLSVHALTRPARARVRGARDLSSAPEASVARP